VVKCIDDIVLWSRDGDLLPPNAHLHHTNATVVIPKVGLDSGGFYTCYARSNGNVVGRSIYLKVFG